MLYIDKIYKLNWKETNLNRFNYKYADPNTLEQLFKEVLIHYPYQHSSWLDWVEEVDSICLSLIIKKQNLNKSKNPEYIIGGFYVDEDSFKT